MRNKIFQIYQLYETSRQVSYKAAFSESTGKPSFRSFALAKQIDGDNCCHAALVASEIFGARAGLPEFEIGQLLLDAIMTRPPSGTGDVQRKRVLESLLDERIPPWGGGNGVNLR